MDLENVYMGRILRVDLNAGTCEEDELDAGLVEEHLGGAALNLALYRQHLDRDPIVFGTGLLTGTFAPSSCAGVVTGKSPVTGSVCHVPLLWQTAVELKFSGYDFLVILGASENPVRLWLHDELAELADAGDLWGGTVWETTDKLRFEHGDDYVQVIAIGPAAEQGSPLAQISENHWGSRDVFGLGALLGAKKVKAVAMRGLGTLEVADGFLDLCVAAQHEIRSGAVFARQGMAPLLEAAGADRASLAVLDRWLHRNAAAFNCAYAVHSFLMTEEPPDRMEESKKDEPGLLVTDPAGLASLLFLQEALPAVLRRAQQLGLDPLACGALLAREGVTEADAAGARLEALAAGGEALAAAGVDTLYGVAPWPLSDAEETRLAQVVPVFSHGVPPRPLGGDWDAFSAGGEPVERARWWLERMAACSILGICPVSALLSPIFSLERMAGWAAAAVGGEDLTAERLRGACRALVEDTAGLGEPNGSVPAAWGELGHADTLKRLLDGWTA